MRTMLLFSENNNGWQQVPDWVNFLIQFGYLWRTNLPQKRRICIISMPCDSAAASLIALGSLIKDLEIPEANDVDEHFNSLLRYARQYLESCQHCGPRCKPNETRCGYAVRANGWVRHLRQKPTKRLKISSKTDLANGRLLYSYKGGTWWQNPRHSTDWQIDGEPPPQISKALYGSLNADLYAQIVAGSKIIPENLKKSYSGLCFAGRVLGEASTRQICESIFFRSGDIKSSILDLLSIYSWSSSNSVSRITFFNARTEFFDRYTSSPSLVIADGDKSFLKILGRPEFQRSDAIGVYNRILDRTELENIAIRIQDLRQWYAEDLGLFDRLPTIPLGINVMIFKRR
jgi:hypothetical protein